MTTPPNHALQRTRPSRHCCHRGVPRAAVAELLSLGQDRYSFVSAIVQFIGAVKKAFLVAFKGRSCPITTETAWDSMVLAASEEWVDDTVFRFTLSLPAGTNFPEFAGSILDAARTHPDLHLLQKPLASRYLISEPEALTAIDRALGGVVRAATLNPRACPDSTIDPVAAAAFEISTENLTIIDSIFPDWHSWRPGLHSASP